MKINGTPQSVQGKSFSEIGKLLQEASPAKDGVGLIVELTEEEESVFGDTFGMRIGYAICELIADAVKATGSKPKLQYKYLSHNRVFITTATE